MIDFVGMCCHIIGLGMMGFGGYYFFGADGPDIIGHCACVDMLYVPFMAMAGAGLLLFIGSLVRFYRGKKK